MLIRLVQHLEQCNYDLDNLMEEHKSLQEILEECFYSLHS